MINSISISDFILSQKDKTYITLPFYQNGIPLNTLNVKWGMSLRSASSMRFRWNECNPNREKFLKRLSGSNIKPVSLELIHSHIVFNLVTGNETQNEVGDGMITKNQNLLPVVTVADCMPIFFYDTVTGVFGVVHSGWKGTGIIEEAIMLSNKTYGSNTSDFSFAIGPHIGSCCYIVDEQRAAYFVKNFGSDCVTKVTDDENSKEIIDAKKWNKDNASSGNLYHLSLTKANLNVLKKIGAKDENIVIADDCTCCNEIFGSFRRETSNLPSSVSKDGAFTVQAAFTGCVC